MVSCNKAVSGSVLNTSIHGLSAQLAHFDHRSRYWESKLVITDIRSTTNRVRSNTETITLTSRSLRPMIKDTR